MRSAALPSTSGHCRISMLPMSTHGDQRLDLVENDGLVCELDERLGQRQGERPEPSAETADENQGLHFSECAGCCAAGARRVRGFGGRCFVRRRQSHVEGADAGGAEALAPALAWHAMRTMREAPGGPDTHDGRVQKRGVSGSAEGRGVELVKRAVRRPRC